MSLFEAVALMRGRKGTSIQIYILREGIAEPQLYEIQRDTVKVDSVRASLVEPGIGHLRVISFQERTADDVQAALEDLEEKNDGPLEGLVIDLRDNPGGLLNQAVEVADEWLNDGLVVYTQGRDESQRIEYSATRAIHSVDYPIVVLVNGGSASASEIVAGALQDHHRAIVLGTPTFGKGSVQTVYPLDGGAGLRLTTALYYTPAGRSIQEVGITPDLLVQPSDDPQLGFPRRRVREKDLQGHFTQADATGLPEKPAAPERILPGTAPVQPGGENPSAVGPAMEPVDVQLSRAVEVLKSWTYFDELQKLRRKDAPTSEDAQAVATVEAVQSTAKPASR
jgi:carboxyl-terminal processing protease